MSNPFLNGNLTLDTSKGCGLTWICLDRVATVDVAVPVLYGSGLRSSSAIATVYCLQQ